MTERCKVCDRKLGKKPHVADTLEDQVVLVGSECYKKIVAAGEAGWQPPFAFPRLYVLTPERIDYLTKKGVSTN